MEVSKISQNLMCKRQKPAVNSNSTAFKGGLKIKAVDELRKTSKIKMPWFIEFMDKLRVLKGETGGIIINALGTGLVAPIFIAFNPLSKADEDTKKYTAMRQPVSAALAIVIQAGLTKPLGEFYDYLANNGKLGKSIWFNQQKLNSESYLKRQAKKTGKNGAVATDTAQKIMELQRKEAVKNLAQNGSILIADKVELSNGQMRAVIDRTIDAYKELIDKQIKEAGQKPIQFKIDRAKLLISPANKTEIVNLCQNLLKCNSLKEQEALLSSYNNTMNKAFSKIVQEFTERGSFEAIQHRAKNTLDKVSLFENSLHRIKFLVDNDAFITEKLNSLKANPSGFESILKELSALSKDAGGNELELGAHLNKIVEELSHRIDDNSRKDYAQKIIERLKAYKKAGNEPLKLIEIYQQSYYRDSLEELINQKAVLDSMKVGNVKEEKNIRNLIRNYQSRMSNSELASLNKQNFVDDIVKTFQKTVDKRFKGYKQITNILVGLFITLPITCHALNWCYPRFMDIFFPSLSKNDKSEAPEEKNKIITGGFGKGAK